MGTKRKEMENLTLQDLLTVDTHGEIIKIQDKTVQKTYDLVSSRQDFFTRIFANVTNEGIVIKHGQDDVAENISGFLNRIEKSDCSCVVLLEGFAGCGKSTLVQYILWKQLKTPNYDYSFYNYDLEAKNDIITHNATGEIVKKSSIFEAIKRSFFNEFVKQLENDKSVFEDFVYMLELCAFFQPFQSLYYDFYRTETFEEIKNYVNDGVTNHRNVIETNLVKQAANITSSVCIFALDYLFRLALYKNRIIEKLYICYDNLDAIEDAEDLIRFDDRLIEFRGLIDDFILMLENNDFFRGVAMPHFVIMATYRKITARMAGINPFEYTEVRNDKNTSANGEETYHIDATAAFSYSDIVSKRREYFVEYIRKAPNISDESRTKLIKSFDSWDKLNQELEIMHDRYACLWNRNYRTCSIIADKLYSESSYSFMRCVDFIGKSRIHDGYYSTTDNEGDSVLCTYYGGSAILLSSVCKVFNRYHIWDKLLQLAPLTKQNTSYRNVSLARLILTYIYNSDRPVSLEELYNIFCKNKLFTTQKMCSILSGMLARNKDGVWRRPIYYANECIYSEDANSIEDELINECQQLKAGGTAKNYTFLLCDSGKTYVERLMQEFEFFSNRLSNKNQALYIYDSIDEIEETLGLVCDAVERCCKNTLEFREKYIKLNGVSDEEYLSLPIHPTTNTTCSPQLHIERIIFSHIGYLNNVRRYFLDVNVISDLEQRKKYNILFIDYIRRYIGLYFDYVWPISSRREKIASELKMIVDDIDEAIKNNDDKTARLFKSISIDRKTTRRRFRTDVSRKSYAKKHN